MGSEGIDVAVLLLESNVAELRMKRKVKVQFQSYIRGTSSHRRDYNLYRLLNRRFGYHHVPFLHCPRHPSRCFSMWFLVVVICGFAGRILYWIAMAGFLKQLMQVVNLREFDHSELFGRSLTESTLRKKEMDMVAFYRHLEIKKSIVDIKCRILKLKIISIP